MLSLPSVLSLRLAFFFRVGVVVVGQMSSSSAVVEEAVRHVAFLKHSSQTHFGLFRQKYFFRGMCENMTPFFLYLAVENASAADSYTAQSTVSLIARRKTVLLFISGLAFCTLKHSLTLKHGFVNILTAHTRDLSSINKDCRC